MNYFEDRPWYERLDDFGHRHWWMGPIRPILCWCMDYRLGVYSDEEFEELIDGALGSEERRNEGTEKGTTEKGTTEGTTEG